MVKSDAAAVKEETKIQFKKNKLLENWSSQETCSDNLQYR